MVNKKFWKTVLWVAIYLALTMVLMEKLGIVPANVPGGLFGWTGVEFIRVAIGFTIINRIYKRSFG